MSGEFSLSSMEEAWLEQGNSNKNTNKNTNMTTPSNTSVVTENDDFPQQPLFALTPIHEAPARSRLHTAETDIIQNFKKSMNTAMAAAVKAPTALRRNKSQEGSVQTDEASSVVSSLSKDDSLLARPPLIVPSLNMKATPPTEVSIPCDANSSPSTSFVETTPDWLLLQQSRSSGSSSISADLTRPSLVSRDASAPAILMAHSSFRRPSTASGTTASVRGVQHVRTSLLAPKILRPTHGRNHSCPRMEVSVTSSSGSSLDALFSNHETSLSSNRSISPNSARLVGSRKRRTHVRSKSNATASGCHSSLTTAPTVASSNSAMTADAASHHHQKSCQEELDEDDAVSMRSMRSKRNVVKEELKYVMNLVSTPILKLPLLKKVSDATHQNRNVDLTRADGCLT